MSLLINGMDMPKDCYYCALYSVIRGHCPLVERGSFNEPLGHRHPDCPLVEIPTPHGKLIDADEIRTSIESIKAIESAMPVHTQQQIFDLIIKSISNAATVIEAEE